MLKRHLLTGTCCKFRILVRGTSRQMTTSNTKPSDLTKIRNIGILAHIDAGKTTTTERMLYYSGMIGNMGEVHHGNTVTDYMEQERQRGITITSAAVTFGWKDYRFNLIDTPGHIDFTMEVEQTLNILDGVVVVLDGSAGVEAQTSTVWRQADRYDLPRIIYVNKMDRLDADLGMNIKSVESKLATAALPTQMPVQDKNGLSGIVDLLTLELMTFDKKDSGMKVHRVKLTEAEDGSVWERACEMRRQLTDKLSGLDDKLAEMIIEQESLEQVSSQMLLNSLRRSTISRKGVPLVLGSAYKNIGVQPLMDSIIFYLPSPEGNPNAQHYSCFKDNFSARVFKIIHDKQRGPLTFMRIYSGQIKQGQKIYNIQQEKVEQIGRLYIAYADEYKETPMLKCGSIAAVAGLKSTVIGDVITSNASTANQVKKAAKKYDNITVEDVDSLFGTSTCIPSPVFFCSIEPPSLAYQVPLDIALEQLQREDPSLRVTQDAETGQTVLAGMGELHLEIIKDRIRTEYNIEADLGPLQIAYKESLQHTIKDTYVTSHKIGNTNHNVKITMSALAEHYKKDILILDKSPDYIANTTSISPRILQVVKNGITTALAHGPKLGCPVINVGIMLHWLEIGRGTSDTMVSAAVTQCIQKLLRAGGTALFEPIMQLEIVTSENTISQILADLSRRRAHIQQVMSRGSNKVVYALTPLAELLGYSTTLRVLTSGQASFSLEFDRYQEMDAVEESKATQRVTGFAS